MEESRLNAERPNDACAPDDSVPVYDVSGNLVGYTKNNWSAEELADAERRLNSDEPGYTFAEVVAHLEQLEKP